MRRGLKFEGVAVAGIGMVRFNNLRDVPLMHMARDAGLLAETERAVVEHELQLLRRGRHDLRAQVVLGALRIHA